MLPLIIGGAMGLGGALLNKMGQDDANATNVAMARENNAFSKQQADAQMAFQKDMASSAHQREVEDLRKAGLNPILSANGGAATPSGAQGSVSTPRVENSMSGVGDAIKGLAPSALAMMQGLKGLEQTDAQISAQKASTVASIAQAKNSDASALATKATIGKLTADSAAAKGHHQNKWQREWNENLATHAKAKADAEEARLREGRARYDQGLINYDGAAKRIIETIGGASDAVSLRRLIQGGKHADRNQTMREESHLNRQGLKGSILK